MPRDQDWNDRNAGRGGRLGYDRDAGRYDGAGGYDEGRSWDDSRQDSWRGQHVRHVGRDEPYDTREQGRGDGGHRLEGYGRGRIAGGYGQRGYGQTGVGQNANDQGGVGQGGFGQSGVNQGDYGQGVYRGDPGAEERQAGGYRPYGYGRDRQDRYGYDAYGRRDAPIGAQANPTLSEITNGEHRGRGPKNYTRSDERIREDVSDRLADAGDVDASDIEVAVEGGEVTLSGQVRDRGAKRRAEDLADDVSGVKHVQNNLRVTQNDTLNSLTADAARI